MIQIHKIYESILSETSAEACVKKFGQVLFGDELGGKEKNTGLENHYADEIKDFTDNRYGHETTPEFMSAVKNLHGCMGQYPDVLVPENTYVYRGINIPVKYFIDLNQIIDIKAPNRYVYKANNPIQSWTTNPDIAAMFGNHDVVNEIAQHMNFNDYNTPDLRQELLKHVIEEGLTIAFVLKYHTNFKEFMFKSKYFKMLSAAQHEDELLRIDNKSIVVEALFNNSEDVFLSSKGLSLMKYINKAIEESK